MRFPGLIAAMLLSACSTSYVHFSDEQRVSPYAGTRWAIRQTARSWQNPLIPGEMCIWSHDILFSFAADTVLLPLDIVSTWFTDQPSDQKPTVEKLR